MKKIGLAVCYDTKNFGSQLQVLATIKVLMAMGYKTEIIRYTKKLTPKTIIQTIPRLFNISFVKSKLKRNDKLKKASVFPNILEYLKIRDRKFIKFAETHFTCLSPEFFGWENLVNECKTRYDAFICGSDQLWLPNNLGSHFYTLEFAPDDKPKISYATSFGVSYIPFFQKRNTSKFLNRFSSLSTRETAGASIIKDLTGKNAEVVCDPTMLITSEEWTQIIPDKSIFNEPYIFCYFLGTNENHRKIALELKNKTNLKIITVPFLDNFIDTDIIFGDIQLYDIDSADFINLIRHAEYILTDSFHGTVFSILYNKPFMIFNRFGNDKNSRNSRIDTICSTLNLNERRYDGSVIKIENPIDYKDVNNRLRILRESSINFLQKALDNNKQ